MMPPTLFNRLLKYIVSINYRSFSSIDAAAALQVTENDIREQILAAKSRYSIFRITKNGGNGIRVFLKPGAKVIIEELIKEQERNNIGDNNWTLNNKLTALGIIIAVIAIIIPIYCNQNASTAQTEQPKIEIVNPGLYKLEANKRLEVMYQIENNSSTTVQLTNGKIGWTVASPDMVREWEKYQQDKISTDLPIYIPKGRPKAMKITGGFIDSLTVEFIKKAMVNVYVFGDLSFSVEGETTEYIYNFVIWVKPDGSFAYIKNENHLSNLDQ